MNGASLVTIFDLQELYGRALDDVALLQERQEEVVLRMDYLASILREIGIDFIEIEGQLRSIELELARCRRRHH